MDLPDHGQCQQVMEEQRLTPDKKLKGRKVVRILVRIIGIVVLVIATIALLILTPPVQRFIVSKAETWLSKKLQTTVSVGKLYIGFPKKVVLENLFIADQQKDTLLSAGKLSVNIAMLKLIKSEVEIDDLDLDGLTAKIKRNLPDTVFNYQFIVDAFASGDTTTADPTDTSSTKIALNNISLDNIRLVYQDVVTGNDVNFQMGHLDTRFQTFDLDKMVFSVPATNIAGIRAKVHQTKPLVESVKETIDSAAPANTGPSPQFNFKKFNLKDSYVDYKSEPDSMSANVNLGEFKIEADSFDLAKQKIVLKNVSLNKTVAAVELGKTATAESKDTSAVVKDTSAGWNVLVKSLRLNNNNIVFNNKSAVPVKSGMDYSHINAKGITFHANNLVYNKDAISANVVKGELYEKSGFVLKTFRTDFLYSANQAYLKNLLVETPGTTLQRSMELKFASLDAVKKDIGKLELNVDIEKSKVQVKDILTFAPFLDTMAGFKDPNATFYATANITGAVEKMNIRRLQLSAFSGTILDIAGTINGLPDAKKVNGNITLNNVRTTESDIRSLAPKGSLPSGITLPKNILVKGNMAGSMRNVRATIALITNLGNAELKGTAADLTDSVHAKYDVALNIKDLQLGTLLQNDTLYGPLTASLTAKGVGYDPKTANAKANATIISAVYNKYRYQNIVADAGIASQIANLKLTSNDPNVDLELDGEADISGKYPTLVLNGDIRNLQTFPLHLTSDTIAYKGALSANFINLDPSNLDGKLVVSKSVLKLNAQTYPIDTMSLTSGQTDSGKFVRLNTEAVGVELTGKYDLAQLGAVFQQAIQPYYAISTSTKPDTLKDYDFRFKGEVVNGPLLKMFVQFDSLATVKMNGHFTSTRGWETNLSAPLVIMTGSRLDSLHFRAATGNDSALHVKGGMKQYSSGSTLAIFRTDLDAEVAHNNVNFLLKLKDSAQKDKYSLGGWLKSPSSGAYNLSLNPDSLLLNYDKWVIAADNLVKYDSTDLNIRDFVISNKGQKLGINSSSSEPNAPLEVSFGDFRISTITAFLKQDSILADGTINGKVVVNDIQKQPTFTSDLNVANLAFRNDTIGNLAMKVSNTRENIFDADIKLTGSGNDIAITGDYEVKPENQSLINLSLAINKLQMTTVEAFSMGAISRAKGFISGKLDVDGTPEKPDLNGKFAFNQTGFSPTILGSYFTINQENIFLINNKGIKFDSFSIKDSLNNELNIDGEVMTSNFLDYKFDLNITADNFQALNSVKGPNKLFWGQFFFDTDLHISGTPTSPKVDGDLTVNDKTNLTVVLPQDEPGIEEREGVIRFVDMDSVKRNAKFTVSLADSLSKSDVTGMDVSVNIEIKKDAELTLIVDEGNGDFLRMKGVAQLTGGIDPSGKTTLAGSYEIDEGAYELSVNVLKRRFDIQKGSKIVWLGEPTRANVNLTALYHANTAPLTLVENQITDAQNKNVYKQKLPFQVNLILTGELMKPDIKFDLLLPDQDKVVVSGAVTELVNARLTQLRNEPSELNKQVFALLLLNRFVDENPFSNSGSDGFSAGTAARQSVSKILAQQLNNLAADLINGVDVNFDLNSTEDYTTGNRENRTDLNVSLSKDLLNDRLKVTVGSNFELEGPQNSAQKQSNLAPNVALDYLLSKDGRYMIRAYRKNEYEGVLDGFIIETGVNFILTFDYNRLRELFHSPKEKKKNVKPEKKKSKSDTPEGTEAGL